MGRPKYEPTDADRAKVKEFALAGYRDCDIAEHLGISESTVEKYFRPELDYGRFEANAKIAGTLYEEAIQNRDITALIFLAKTRLGWRETNDLNVINKNYVMAMPDEAPDTNTWLAKVNGNQMPK